MAVEALCKAEADAGRLEVEQCADVVFWKTQRLGNAGKWSGPQDCVVPLTPAHQALAMCLAQRIYSWIAGLGFAVADAVVPKTRAEGTGHHDLKLKRALPQTGQGFVSTELKIAHASPNGSGFGRAWEKQEERSVAKMARVLTAPRSIYASALLFVVGICDTEDLRSKDPPLLVKAQLLVLNAANEPKWGSVLLEKGVLPVAPTPPPPKRQRLGSSWGEVRASLQAKQQDIGGVTFVRLLDLFTAISANKTAKNPGQKMATYQKVLSFKRNADFKQVWHPKRARGSPPYWLTWAAARRAYDYELSQ